MRTRWLLIAILILGAGCNDDGDSNAPAAPRGVYTVTGDGEVFVHWLANTESDVAGYRIYDAPCASGGSCPYDRVGTTAGTSFTVTGLSNGETRYYAVAAFDHAGNESELSAEVLFDTPRPEGLGRVLADYQADSVSAGYDFSAFAVRGWGDPQTDMFFGFSGGVYQMFVPDFNTDIQDAGYRTSLDGVDYAPIDGWSPSGSVEVIVGHCYIVWTRDDHYAKFRVNEVRPATSTAPAQVVFDWAYQVDEANRELRASKVKNGERGATRPISWIQ